MHIELGTTDLTTIRTLDGRHLTAVLADEVDPRLVAECRRTGRPMIACDTARGPTVVGALQTAPSLQHEPDGSLVLHGKEVRLVADKGVRIEAGTNAFIALESTGKTRLVGDRLVLDMSANVRVLSALVELP